MAAKKSTQRRGRFYPLHVSYNPETNELRVRAFIEIGDEYIENPILDMLRDDGPPPRGKPVLRLIRGGR